MAAGGKAVVAFVVLVDVGTAVAVTVAVVFSVGCAQTSTN